MTRKRWLLLLLALLALTLPASLIAQGAVYRVDLGEGPYPNARTGGNYMFNYYLPPPGTSTPSTPPSEERSPVSRSSASIQRSRTRSWWAMPPCVNASPKLL